MKKMLKKFTPVLLAVVCLTLVLSAPAMAGTAGLITKEELKQMLDHPDLVILDVRTGRDWKSSEFKIEGAVRANSKDLELLSKKYGKDKKYVTYCA